MTDKIYLSSAKLWMKEVEMMFPITVHSLLQFLVCYPNFLNACLNPFSRIHLANRFYWWEHCCATSQNVVFALIFLSESYCG